MALSRWLIVAVLALALLPGVTAVPVQTARPDFVVNPGWCTAHKIFCVDLDALQIPTSGIETERAILIEGESCLFFTSPRSAEIASVQILFSYSLSGGGFEDQLADFGVAPGWTKEMTGCNEPGSIQSAGDYLAFISGVHYRDGSSWQLVPLKAGTVANSPDSPISLRDVRTYTASYPNGSGRLIRVASAVQEECVTITNVSNRKIKREWLRFEHVATDGAVLGSEVLDLAGMSAGTTVTNACRTFSAATSPDIRDYALALSRGDAAPAPIVVYASKPSTLLASVDEVDFDDGFVWRAPGT